MKVVGRKVGDTLAGHPAREIPRSDQSRVGHRKVHAFAKPVQPVDRLHAGMKPGPVDLAVVEAVEQLAAAVAGLGRDHQRHRGRPFQTRRPWCLDALGAVSAGLRVGAADHDRKAAGVSIPACPRQHPLARQLGRTGRYAPRPATSRHDELQMAFCVEAEPPALLRIFPPARQDGLGAVSGHRRPQKCSDGERLKRRERRRVGHDGARARPDDLVGERHCALERYFHLVDPDSGPRGIGIATAHAHQGGLGLRYRRAGEMEGYFFARRDHHRPRISQNGCRIGHASFSLRCGGRVRPVTASQRSLKTSHSASAMEVKT